MFKVNNIFLKFYKTKGVYVKFDNTKINFIIGANTIGKSIIIRMIPTLLGNTDKLDFLLKHNSIEEDFIAGMSVEIKKVDFKIKLIRKGSESFYWTNISGEWEMFTSKHKSEFRALIQNKIIYPLMTAWDNSGKSTQLSDILLPIYIDQKHWQMGELTKSLDIKYKHSNRIASSLAFWSDQDNKLYEKINNDELLIKKYLNYSRENVGKIRLKKAIKSLRYKSDNDIEDMEYKNYISCTMELHDIKNQIRKYKTMLTKDINSTTKHCSYLSKYITKNSKQFNELQKEEIQLLIKQFIFSSSTRKVDVVYIDSLYLRKNELDKKIIEYSNVKYTEKFTNYSLPENLLLKIENEIKEDKRCEPLSNIDKEKIDGIDLELKHLYYKIRDKFWHAIDEIGIKKDIAFNFINAGGTEGTNDIRKVYLKMYDEFNTGYIIFDSIFSEDRGTKDGKTTKKTDEKMRIIKEIIKGGRKGIVSFVIDDAMTGFLNDNNDKINIINMNMESGNKLNKQTLTTEELEEINSSYNLED